MLDLRQGIRRGVPALQPGEERPGVARKEQGEDRGTVRQGLAGNE